MVFFHVFHAFGGSATPPSRPTGALYPADCLPNNLDISVTNIDDYARQPAVHANPVVTCGESSD
jgi:hypothetical protein